MDKNNNKKEKLLSYPSKEFMADIEANKDNPQWLASAEELTKYKWGSFQRDWLKKNKLIPAIVNSMLKFAGYPDVTYDYVVQHPYVEDMDWFNHYTWTVEQENEFKTTIFKPLLKRFMPHATSHGLDSEMSWFMLSFGLACMSDLDKENLRLRNIKEKIEQCERFGITQERWLELKTENMKDKEHKSFILMLFAEKYGVPYEQVQTVAFKLNKLYSSITDKEMEAGLKENKTDK